MRLRALLGPPIILGLVWAGAIWWPSQRAISSANEEADQAQSEQLSLITDIDRLNQTSDLLPSLDRDIAAVARSIPSDAELEGFFATLALAAEQSGVRVNLVSPTEVLDAATTDANRPVPTGMTAVAISVEAEGDFNSVMAFATSLDDLPRMVVVDQVGMVAVEGGTQLVVIDMSLRVFSGGSTSAPSLAVEPNTAATLDLDEEPVQELSE